MKLKILLYISLLALASCRHDTPDSPDPDSRVLKMLLIVDNLPETRADESFEQGIPGESYLDINKGDVTVYFFSPDNIFMTSVSPASFNYLNDSGQYELITAPIIGLPDSGNVKVVIAANCNRSYPGLVPGISTLDQLYSHPETILYAPSGLPGNDADFLIPFFGLKEITLNYDAGGNFNAGTIYLLRALAKITVICKQGSGMDESYYALQSAKLINAKSQLHTLPKGVYSESGYATPEGSNPTLADNWNSPLNIPECDSKDLPFVKLDETTFVLYAPEAAVMGESDTSKPYIHLDFGNNVTDRLDFKDYTKGSDKVYDLHRNWHFKYSVTKSGPLSITLDVVPYCLVELNPDFGIGEYDDPFKN